MSTCPKCKTKSLFGPEWNEPPCIYPTSNNIFELPEYTKIEFVDVLCTCEHPIGVMVFSGLKKQVGKWRIFGNKQSNQSLYKNLKQEGFQKFIFEKFLRNNIFSVLQQQNQNKLVISGIEMLLKVLKKNQDSN